MQYRALVTVLLVWGWRLRLWRRLRRWARIRIAANDGSTCASSFAFAPRTVASGSTIPVTIGGAQLAAPRPW